MKREIINWKCLKKEEKLKKKKFGYVSSTDMSQIWRESRPFFIYEDHISFHIMQEDV